MKKILLTVIIFVHAFTIAYSQCTKPTSVAITNPATGLLTICQGTAQPLSGAVTVTAASQNGGFTYSWIKKGITPAADVVLQTATMPLIANTPTVLPSYTGITGMVTNAGTYTLRVEDGNAGNATCYTEASVVVTVNSLITPGAIAASQTICTGDNPVAFTPTTLPSGGNGTTYTYVWEKSLNSGPFTPIASATNASYDEGILSNSGTTPLIIDYRRSVISGVCPQVAATPVRITVNPSVIAGVIAADQTICSGSDPVAFTQTTAASGGSGVYTYKWESATNNTTGPFTTIAVASNATYDAPAGLTATTYYRRVDGSGTCATATTNVITVTVQPSTTAGVISTSQTICSGDDPVAFSVTTAAGGGNGTYTYQWEKAFGTGSYADIAGATNAMYDEGILTNAGIAEKVISYRRKVTSGSCPQVTSNLITITVNPTIPSSVSIATPNTSICAGTSVTFTATPSNGGGVPIYQWYKGPVGSGTSLGSAYMNSTYTTTTATNNDSYYVVMTSNSACSVPAIVTSNAVVMTVNSGIGSGTIGTDQTICYNTVPAAITQLTAATGIIGTATYQWEASLININAWVNIPGATTASYTPAVPLTQDVYIRRITTDPGTPALCNVATSNTVHITVRPQLTAGVIGVDETLCSGAVPSMITQIAAPIGGTGTYTYQWESDAATQGTFTPMAGATSSSYTSVVLTRTTQFRRVETSTGGCESVTSNIVTKTVAAPEAYTVLVNDPGQTCAGSSLTFTATATPSSFVAGTLSYAWSLGGVTVGTNSPTYTYNPVIGDNGKVVQVVVTTSNGCSTAPWTSNVVTLDIVSATTPTVSITTNNNPNCAGLVNGFVATSTGIGNAPSYQWYVIPSGGSYPGNPAGTSGTTYNSYTLSDGDKVYVELTSSIMCMVGTNPYKSNEITMLIKQVPTPVINEGDQTICAPNLFTYGATVGTGTSYQWTFNGTAIPGATTATYVASQTGMYSIQEGNGICSSAAVPVTLTVSPCGGFSTSISGPNPITPGQQNAVYSVVNQTGFTYQWSITGGTIISGQNTNSVTVDWDAANAFARTTASAHSISVKETNTSQVQKTTTLDVTTLTTGIAKSLAQSGIVLFPNPTADAFYIEMPESGLSVSYDILDVTGLSVASGTFTSSTGQQKIEANFSAGIYQVVLHYNNVVTCGRLSKVQ